jgi:exosortase
VLAHAFEVWTTDQEFSFALLVPPITLGLLWLRRRALLAAVGRGAAVGLVPLLCGLLLLLASTRSGVHAMAGAALLPTVLGITIYLYGVAAARVVAFPAAFLTASLCLYRGLLNSVGFALQAATARASAGLAGLLGTQVHRSGADLFVGRFHFVVAEACSGMSSLVALLCLGILVAGLTQATVPRRLILLVLIVPIVLAANIIRVTLVLMLSHPFGLAVAQSPLHEVLSAVLFLGAFGQFCLLGRVLGCSLRWDAIALS